jgi:glucose-1-phosphate thymidylyltransferase
MKGVILAGGTGTRLHPLTISVNKHLLPVGSKPMILHCVDRLVEAGVTDILIVTNPEYVGDFSMLLKSGKAFGCKITYKTQDKPDGVAGALFCAKEFVGADSCIVLLGDNMFNFSIKEHIKSFDTGCRLFFKMVPDGHRYGVGRFDDGRLLRIDEKPSALTEAYACIGIYGFDHRAFEIIGNLKPSARGEYEIADVINQYLAWGQVTHQFVDGWWTDAGTMPSYKKANEMMCNDE